MVALFPRMIATVMTIEPTSALELLPSKTPLSFTARPPVDNVNFGRFSLSRDHFLSPRPVIPSGDVLSSWGINWSIPWCTRKEDPKASGSVFTWKSLWDLGYQQHSKTQLATQWAKTVPECRSTKNRDTLHPSPQTEGTSPGEKNKYDERGHCTLWLVWPFSQQQQDGYHLIPRGRWTMNSSCVHSTAISLHYHRTTASTNWGWNEETSICNFAWKVKLHTTCTHALQYHCAPEIPYRWHTLQRVSPSQ